MKNLVEDGQLTARLHCRPRRYPLAHVLRCAGQQQQHVSDSVGTDDAGLAGPETTAVLYIYPFESHAPVCKQTLQDLWARPVNWFDKYVKNAPAETVSEGQ